MTKEHPFLFKREMILALKDRRKTMTRRVVTAGNSLIDGTGRGIKKHWPHLQWDKAWVDPGPSPAGNPGPYWKVPCNRPGYCDDAVHRVYPRVQARDRIWAKETWGAVWPDVESVPLEECDIEYRADLPPGCTDRPGGWPCDADGRTCWNPSIYMPRWVARFVLPVVGVRAERVQEISEADARAEGVDWASPEFYEPSQYEAPDEKPEEVGYPSAGASFARDNFRRLWDSINTARGFGWDTNPPVWC